MRVTILAADRQTAVDFPVAPDGAVHPGRRGGEEVGRAAFSRVLELALPFEALGLRAGMRLALSVHTLRGDVQVERLPRYGFVAFTVPDESFEHVNWRV